MAGNDLNRNQRRAAERNDNKITNGNGMRGVFVSVALISFLFIIGVFFLKNTNSDNSFVSPGEEVEDLGRDHVTDIYGVEYSSNPPSSGPHFPIWAKSGVYDRFISDGYLIHSLEHGYIVISYDCSKLDPSGFGLIPTAYAHDEPGEDIEDSGELLMHMNAELEEGTSWITPQNPPGEVLPLPQAFNSDVCASLSQTLSVYADDYERIIVVPRQNMDTAIALTAWGRVDKMEDADDFKIREFIAAYNNKGPEKTIE